MYDGQFYNIYMYIYNLSHPKKVWSDKLSFCDKTCPFWPIISIFGEPLFIIIIQSYSNNKYYYYKKL